MLRYVALIAGSAASVDSAEKALNGVLPLVPSAARLDQASQIVTSGNDGKHWFVDLLLVEQPWGKQEWDQIRSVSFKVAATGAFKDVVKAHPAPLEGRYALERSHVAFDVGFGLQFGFGDEIRDTTWEAVSDPTDKSKKAIGATRRTNRTGIPIVVLTLMPSEWKDAQLSPGLDFGVSLNPDKQFLSFGASIKVGSFLRIGGAWIRHRLKTLEPGQTPLGFDEKGALDPKTITTVGATTDIRTFDTTKGGFQYTVAITLAKLNPFKKN